MFEAGTSGRGHCRKPRSKADLTASVGADLSLRIIRDRHHAGVFREITKVGQAFVRVKRVGGPFLPRFRMSDK